MAADVRQFARARLRELRKREQCPATAFRGTGDTIELDIASPAVRQSNPIVFALRSKRRS